MDDEDFLGTVEVRMGVGAVGDSVGRPAGVGNPDRTLGKLLLLD